MIIRTDTYVTIIHIPINLHADINRYCVGSLYGKIMNKMGHLPYPSSVFDSYIGPMFDRFNYTV